MLHTILLQAQGADKGNSWMYNLAMFGLIIVVFYFFMILPQTRKAKQQKQFREGLAKGDKIITIGGVLGKIVEITDESFLIDSEGTKLRVQKSAISMEASLALKEKK